jgi:hypothetical protein
MLIPEISQLLISGVNNNFGNAKALSFSSPNYVKQPSQDTEQMNFVDIIFIYRQGKILEFFLSK